MAKSGPMIGRRSVLGAAGLLMAQPVYARAAGAKPRVVIQTGRGTIVVELEDRKAPKTSRNFLRYVDNDYFKGGDIWRAMKTPGAPEEGTIQGQPRGDLRRYPPVEHESTEKTGLKHDTGSISLARYGPGTATADFFICLGPQPFFDAHPDETGDNQGYAVFGFVAEGLDVVRRIHGLPTSGKAAFKELKGQVLTHPMPILGMKRSA